MSALSLDDLKPVIESLSSDELKLITKSRGIKGYKNMSRKRLLSALSKPKIDNESLKKIREGFNKLRHTFAKSETKGGQNKSLRNREQKKSFNTKNKRD